MTSPMTSVFFQNDRKKLPLNGYISETKYFVFFGHTRTRTRTCTHTHTYRVGELPDGHATIWCQNIPEKLNPLSRVHTHVTDDSRQTDGFVMPLAKRNVVTFG